MISQLRMRLTTFPSLIHLPLHSSNVRNIQTESGRIMSTVNSNKVGLSLDLDKTMKSGHDMKIFGLGTLATMSNLERYTSMHTSFHAIYTTLESTISTLPPTSPTHKIFQTHGKVLNRSSKIRSDLLAVDVAVPLNWDGDDNFSELTPATQSYIRRIRECGDEDRSDNGGRLMGHIYTRYFADLFGGQQLGRPTMWALGLKEPPRMYEFDFGGVEGGRKGFIEGLYGTFNAVGEGMKEEERRKVVEEALTCFELNKKLYSEEEMYWSAVKGGVNIVTGAVASLKPSFGNPYAKGVPKT